MKGLRSALDRLAMYLPVIVMGMLALASYWLVRNAPALSAPAVQRAPSHDPDYWINGFAMRQFDATGRLKSEVRGDVARHYPDTDRFEIDRVHMQSWDERGRLTVATAMRAISNSDSTTVELVGQAVVVRAGAVLADGRQEQDLEIRGEYLLAERNGERLSSDRPVVLTRGGDQLHADRLDYRNLDRVLQLEGRVRGVLHPRPGP